MDQLSLATAILRIHGRSIAQSRRRVRISYRRIALWESLQLAHKRGNPLHHCSTVSLQSLEKILVWLLLLEGPHPDRRLYKSRLLFQRAVQVLDLLHRASRLPRRYEIIVTCSNHNNNNNNNNHNQHQFPARRRFLLSSREATTTRQG